ncbi:MAG: TonB-dependent receptor [Muribaculaceae bacterium]|nr:TonB-dependent receptor [Muribaculaceae bacterium]
MRSLLGVALWLCAAAFVSAQSALPDTSALTRDLEEVVIETHVRGNYLSATGLGKREVISMAGLKKMACCTLAESFENSASVTVGYNDAVSGTRQIKMLGLAGIYTQFLDESRPIMRGFSAPYALNYTPGDWLQSIQVSKGVASVTAGHEAITGQINLEYRKPTAEERLHLNLYVDDMLHPEVNLAAALPLTADKSLSTIIMAHGALDTDWREMRAMDVNRDGFRDAPRQRQVDVANRWFWLAPSGAQLRWGGRWTQEDRLGGQLMAHDYGQYKSHIKNHQGNFYVKAALPMPHAVLDTVTGEEKQSNLAAIIDFDTFDTDSYFGLRSYVARDNTATATIRYDHYVSMASTLTAGVQGRTSRIKERAVVEQSDLLLDRDEREGGLFVEHTWMPTPKFTLVTGVRADYNNLHHHWVVTPRLHVKCDVTPTTILRASVGTGHRSASPLTDNLGLFATGYALDWQNLPKNGKIPFEKALTAGGSVVQTFTLGRDHNASVSVDYFHTQFSQAMVANQEMLPSTIVIYATHHTNRADTWQLDLNWEPVERLDVLATMRYTHSRLALPVATTAGWDWIKTERPLTSRMKALLNVSYATRFRVWAFDATVQLNGPMRVPAGGRVADAYHSPTFATLFAQVTHKIGKSEVYVGCENLAGYRQHDPIVAADAPFGSQFNAMNVWGPIMGRKFYAGLRWNLY